MYIYNYISIEDFFLFLPTFKKKQQPATKKIVAIRFFLGIGNPFWKQYSKVDATKKGYARCMCEAGAESFGDSTLNVGLN
jgi:hypothetical protein